MIFAVSFRTGNCEIFSPLKPVISAIIESFMGFS